MKTTLTAITLTTFLSISQVAMAEHQDASGYDFLLNNPTSQMVTPHSEDISLNGNLENSATYGALYNSIASPTINRDNGHGIHEHKFAQVGLADIQNASSHELVGDTFYFETRRLSENRSRSEGKLI